MLERFVAESGTGYTAGKPPRTLADEPLTYKGIETVSYLSIFGSVDLPRAGYARPGGGCEYPLDGQWNRPTHKYSYLLQKWLQAVAVESDYGEATQRLNEMFDWPCGRMSRSAWGVSWGPRRKRITSNRSRRRPTRKAATWASALTAKARNGA